MNTELKPLVAMPAEFDGIKYRSRNEARWAVFFKELGIKFAYEEEGFDLGGGIRYLPDFHIPIQDKFRRDMYFEIKPSASGLIIVDEQDNKKIEALSNYVFISVLGSVHDYQHKIYSECAGYDISGPSSGDCDYLFCQCQFCGAIGFEYLGRAERINCCGKNPYHKDYNELALCICDALEAAKSHRFWK
ncbi:MAG: hypothetical protein EBY22_16870 [Gammaproteobacteria bacterium]|nr:hypothetical protein [Gammaproteobacteria bacterium]